MKGIRRHGAGWQASVYVAGAGRRFEPFPLDTPEDVMQGWRRAARAELQLQVRKKGPGRVQAGTFEADVQRYLRAVTAMPTLKHRAKDLELWCAVFAGRRRDSITPVEIRAQRDAWLTRGPKWRLRKATGDQPAFWEAREEPLAASTVNHRLRALSNLFRVLDGPNAYNPVRDVPEADEGDGEPRGLPWAVASAILDAMPDRGRGERHAKRAEFSQTKARLRVMYWTGLTQKQLAALRPRDVDLEAGTVYVGRRRKGAGAPGHVKALLPEAVEAFRTFDRLKCWGGFSTSSMRKSFLRACRALGLTGLRPYDFRHSFGSDLYAASGDLKAVQAAMGHADIRTTMRYVQAAVPGNVLAAMAKVPRLRQITAPKQELPKDSEPSG